MQIKLGLVVCDDMPESGPQPLLTLAVDAQPTIATLGLSLADGKAMLAGLQTQIVTRQVEMMVAKERRCEQCGSRRAVKDYHDVHYSSLFGNVRVRVPRWRRCRCAAGGAVIADHRGRRWISAELEFVQSRLAATIPYAKSAELLGLLLPVAGSNAPSTVRQHTLSVGRRLDAQGLGVQPATPDPKGAPATTRSAWTAVTCGTATPTTRNPSKSSRAGPCAPASVSAAWRSFEPSTSIRASGSEECFLPSVDTINRWRCSPMATRNCANGS